MSNLWPRIEPLLARVEKPARYIGMERGSQRPHHEAAPGCLPPDLSRHLRDRPPQPGAPDPLRDPERARRRRRRARLRARGPTWRRRCGRRALPLFSVDTHRAAGDFDVLAFNLSAELVYTNLLNLVDLAGVPVRNEDRGPARPDRDRRRALRVQPRAARRVRRRVRDRRRRRSHRRDRRGGRRVEARRTRRHAKPCCAISRRSRASTCRRCTTSSTTGRSSARSRRASPTCPRSSTSAPSPISPSGRTRSNQLVPLVEVVHDRLNVEIFRGCTRGCRFCQAGMITRPVRERPEEQVRTMVREGLRRTGLRRGRAHVAVERRLLRDRRRGRRSRQRPGRHGRRQRVASEPARRRVQRRRSRPRSRRSGAPVSRSRPRPARGGCARSSTS